MPTLRAVQIIEALSREESAFLLLLISRASFHGFCESKNANYVSNMKTRVSKAVKQPLNTLWAREPVKICSEAKYFHNKPPALRVRDKSL